MSFEIDKEYSLRNGKKAKILAFASDGRLIIEHCSSFKGLGIRSADGKYPGEGRSFREYDLIDPTAVTDEERQQIIGILRAFQFNGTAHILETTPNSFYGDKLRKAVEALRGK